jgi:hypothetical protein
VSLNALSSGDAPKEYPRFWQESAYHFESQFLEVCMAASQVVLYFDNQEDALLFTLAASSVISDGPVRTNAAVTKIADEICKASRITTEGVLNPASPSQQ